MCGFGWFVTAIPWTIIGLIWVYKSPVPGARWWIFAGYYLALQLPIYWVHAEAWRLQYVPADQPANMLSLFALQFVQLLLWFR